MYDPKYRTPNPISNRRKWSPKIEEICKELQKLQRHKVIITKSKIMQSNRLQAVIAGSLGYTSTMDENDRKQKFLEASANIKSIVEKDPEYNSHPLASIVRTTMIGILAFEERKKELEVSMKKLVKELPLANKKDAWLYQPEQRGVGEIILGSILGETGNLASYYSPGKLWKRMGCAPFKFEDETKMGATWKSGREGSLPSEEWVKYGYSPRRRSLSFLVGEGIVKLNKSIYRARYDYAKADVKKRNPEYSDLRCHRHGMLLATKLLYKNLWIQWMLMGTPI